MVSIHLNGKGYKFMSESEPETISCVSDLKKKNLIREESIQKETAKVKKIVDLILKTPKENSEKVKAEKTAEKTESSKEKEA